MKIYKIITVALFAVFIIGCGYNSQPRTPGETLKALSEAGKNKDAARVFRQAITLDKEKTTLADKLARAEAN